jgi:glycosyltransferase involved in cell wall biosynthesis
MTDERRRQWQEQLSSEGIGWRAFRYHKRPSLPATIYDTLVGAAYAAVLSRRRRLDVLHARNHVPAAMALIARSVGRRRKPKLIFDVRGLMAEEYVDAGRWRWGGVPFRLTKRVERSALRQAAAIVVLTERVRALLFGSASDSRISVIPCCADLRLLSAGENLREQTRIRLGLRKATVMVYVGKFGGWYMAAETVAFFLAARKLMPRLHFLILTQGDRREIESELRRGEVVSDYAIESVAPHELGGYLAAADFGVCFVAPTPSKVSSSPTKVGEYLAAGLPVLATAGVGDLDRLINPAVGALVSEHTALAYATAVGHLETLLEKRQETAATCRKLARTELSLEAVGIPRYLAMYDRVASTLVDS